MTTNGNTPNGGRATAEQTAPLTPPAEPNRPIPEPKATHYTVEFLVEIDGYHALIRGEELTPLDMLAWTKKTVAGLKAQGFANVRRDVVVNVAPPPAPPPAQRAPARQAPAGEQPRRGREGQPLNDAARRQDQRPRGNQGGGGQRGGRPPAGPYHGEIYINCPECGGGVWDNRQKKAREAWKGPFFACRDQAGCGWVVWKGDGTYESAGGYGYND